MSDVEKKGAPDLEMNIYHESQTSLVHGAWCYGYSSPLIRSNLSQFARNVKYFWTEDNDAIRDVRIILTIKAHRRAAALFTVTTYNYSH